MSKGKGKEAYYFSHDANARQDPKILAMTSVYKAEGYGWYWILVELMREQADYKLNLKGKYAFHAYATPMFTTPERAKEFIEDCIKEFELFESDGESFWSHSLLKRMVLKDEKSNKAREAVKARWNKNKRNTNDIQTYDVDDTNVIHSYDNSDTSELHSNGDEDTNKRKEKESERKEKENERKSSSVEDDDSLMISKIIRFWDSNGFGFNNTFAKEQLINNWFHEPKFREAGLMILHALEIACANNRQNLPYTQAILQKWLDAGCQTLDDTKAYQVQFRNKQGGFNRSKTAPLRKEDFDLS